MRRIGALVVLLCVGAVCVVVMIVAVGGPRESTSPVPARDGRGAMGIGRFVVDELVLGARERRLREMSATVSAEKVKKAEATYDLGCLSASWVPMWAAYERMARDGASGGKYKEMLTDLGDAMLTYMEELGIDVPAEMRSVLRIANRNVEIAMMISVHVEQQLERRYSVHWRRMFAFVATEEQVLTFSRPPFAKQYGPMVPQLIGVLTQIASDVGAGEQTRREMSVLAIRPEDRAAAMRAIGAGDKVIAMIAREL